MTTDKSTKKSDESDGQNGTKEIRIFMDGSFDLMHFGHMNAFRLARSLGTYLVAGINSDESITKCKAAPLMNDEERTTMVSSCKFVDEVVPDCPYIMNKEYLDYIFENFNVDYVIHGDDPCIVDGKDVYATAKETGKFRSIPRTENISTTEIVGRMLQLLQESSGSDDNAPSTSTGDIAYLGNRSKFLTTTRLLRQFSENVVAPEDDSRIIYVDGAWDLLNPGHVAVLKAAKERGDYLIVGVHGDDVVNKRYGGSYPLLNLQERVLSVLGCRYVDDVLVDAPLEIPTEMLSSMKISEVVYVVDAKDVTASVAEHERFKHVKDVNKLTVLPNPSSFSLDNILQRIQSNRENFQSRFERKMKAETDHYNQKYGTKEQKGT